MAELRNHAPGLIVDRKTSVATEIGIAVGASHNSIIRRGSGKRRDECAAVRGTVWVCPAGITEDFIEGTGRGHQARPAFLGRGQRRLGQTGPASDRRRGDPTSGRQAVGPAEQFLRAYHPDQRHARQPDLLRGVLRPVAQIYVVKNDDEIVELANDSHFGLAGVVFSDDIERAKALASRIETGAIWINTFASTAPELPFGGVKRSGYGRELSHLGIKEFVNHKLVLISNAA
jgi:hypothetical protein